MKYLELETFAEFRCVGSDCAFSCCEGGWEIRIDPESYNYYKTVPGEFGDRLKRSIKEQNGNKYFVLSEDGRCSFLNKDNLCDIYINLGEEHLCHTCKTYPRYHFTAGDIKFSGVTIACPVVAKYILEHEEPLRMYFSVDEKESSEISEADRKVSDHAIDALSTAVGILQDREYSTSERLAILTVFMAQFQAYVDGQKEPSGLLELFADHSNLKEILPQTGVYDRSFDSKAAFYSASFSYLGAIRQFELIFPELCELMGFFVHDGQMSISVDELSDTYTVLDGKEVQLWAEQLLTYAMQRYFLQGCLKRDFFNCYLLGTLLFYGISISTIALYHLRWKRLPDFTELVMIIVHTSRILEHDIPVRDGAIDHFKNNRMTDPAFLLKLFS